MNRNEKLDGASAARLSLQYPGKTAFITGAASGFGRALAVELAAAGWRLGLADINAEELAALAAQLTDEKNFRLFVVSVAEADELHKAVRRFADDFGDLDLMVNSAGVGAGGFFKDFPLPLWREVFDVNLLGTVYGCAAAISMMRKQANGGLILNVASAAAFHGLPRVAAYNASKAAVLAFSETLAAELASENSSVRVAVKCTTFYTSNIAAHTLGTEADRKLTQALVDRAALPVETVVRETLKKLGAGKFYIVYPRSARMIWRFKRWLPNLYLRLIPIIARRLIARLEKTNSLKTSK